MSNPALLAAVRVFEAINSGDLSCLTDCVTDDFVDHGSPMPIPPGLAGYTQILAFVHQVLRIRYEMKDLFATDDRIVVRAVASGVGVAEFHGLEAVDRDPTA